MISMLLIVVSFGTLEFGRGLYLYNKISHAADIAARKALTKPDTTNEVLQKEIAEAFSGEALKPGVEVVTPADAGEVAYRLVIVTLPFQPLIPGFSKTFTLRILRRIPMLS